MWPRGGLYGVGTGTLEIAQEFLAMMGRQPFPSPILRLPGFSNRLIHDDALHVAWRSFGPEFVASAIVDVFGLGSKLTMNSSFPMTSTHR